MGERICQRCLRAFYRPEATVADWHERVREDAPAEMLPLAFRQAHAYCDDCLVALFPKVFEVTDAADAQARSDGRQTGGGRWVNPKRGDVMS